MNLKSIARRLAALAALLGAAALSLAGCETATSNLADLYAAQTREIHQPDLVRQVQCNIAVIAIEEGLPATPENVAPDAGYDLTVNSAAGADNSLALPPWSLEPVNRLETLAGTQMPRALFLSWLRTIPRHPRNGFVVMKRFLTELGMPYRDRQAQGETYVANWEFDAEGVGRPETDPLLRGTQMSVTVRDVPRSDTFLVEADVALCGAGLREWNIVDARDTPVGNPMIPITVGLPRKALRRVYGSMAVRDGHVGILAHSVQQTVRPALDSAPAQRLQRHLIYAVCPMRVGVWPMEPAPAAEDKPLAKPST